MKTTKNDIEDGPIDDLTSEDFLDGNVKVRISMYIDRDVVKHFKSEAARLGDKYQTLINKTLRESVRNDKSTAQRLDQLEQEVTKINSNRQQVEKIERAFFRMKGRMTRKIEVAQARKKHSHSTKRRKTGAG